MSTLLSSLSVQQLRKAATLKEKIQSLENELGRIFGSSSKSITAVAPKKKRKMSAGGRARIAAAQKARWAKVKGQMVKQSQPKKRKMSATAKAKIAAFQKARWAKIKAQQKAGKK
jgi:hypothetical protein